MLQSIRSFPIQLLLLLFLALVACQPEQPAFDGDSDEWRHYHGGPENDQYSSLAQINKENVTKLEVAWTYDIRPEEAVSTMKTNPLMVNGTVYVITSARNLAALDAATGTEKWYLDFALIDSTGRPGTTRGLHYWEEGEERRIFYVYATSLYAINADDGTLVAGFGEDGRVPFDRGISNTGGLSVRMTTPGVIYEDYLILGSVVSERWPAAPGHIRAFNVRSGELEWIFHTIPQPDEYGYETWPEEAHRFVGGANAWSGMSLDAERGLVYIPTASPTFDFYGANRHGANLFANCVLALDAATGERRWHYQVVHHDLWDRDLPCPPNLIRIRHEGRLRDVVVQPTKQGHLFVLDRDTGIPLFEINEVDAPASIVEGEEAWPTQPVPAWPPPFTRQTLTEDLIPDIDPETAAYIRQRMKGRQTKRFSPPDTAGVILQPDFGGGAGWGGAAVDEGRRTLVLNANDFPGFLQLYDQEAELQAKSRSGAGSYRLHCASCHGAERQGLHFYPALINVEKKYKPRELAAIIEQGIGAMPGFGFLSKGEQEALVAFLRGDKAGSEEKETVLYADPRQHMLKYAHRGNKVFTDQNGYPGIKPPWATLTAYDIDSWQIKWQSALGSYEELSGPDGPPTGTKTLGGPIITASGLVFIASTADNRIRAFDIENGSVLWEHPLPGTGMATPATYFWLGKQYLVIAVSGDQDLEEPGSYLAFALP